MSGVWLQRIAYGPAQIGHAIAIARRTQLIHVMNDLDYEWLVRSGYWEVDDRPRCPNCAVLIVAPMHYCIDCGYELDSSIPEPAMPVYVATGVTQRL